MHNDEAPNKDLIILTASVAASYVANNRVSTTEISDLIASIHKSLGSLGTASAAAFEPIAPVPAVSIKKSVTPDYLICLEDGKHFKSMKRHLMTKFGMTPDDYRAKWGLPSDYPMVAAGYSEQRSALALSLGLGRKKAEPAAVPAPKAAKPGRGRKAPNSQAEAV